MHGLLVVRWMPDNTDHNFRIRLNCCGTLDVLRPDSRPIQEIQAEDLVALGRLILGLACHNPMAYQNFQKNLDFVGKSSTHSAHLRDFIFWLINGTFPSVDKLAEALTNYTFQNFDAALNYNDNLEAELCRELENGRLVRLMSKLGFINERPEFDHDPRWSETGDRYYIKLFRDYVFHSVDENNQPVVDLAHIITCLNKLDAGVDEKIMLVSRDNNNCFVISYKDVGFNTFPFMLKSR